MQMSDLSGSAWPEPMTLPVSTRRPLPAARVRPDPMLWANHWHTETLCKQLNGLSRKLEQQDDPTGAALVRVAQERLLAYLHAGETSTVERNIELARAEATRRLREQEAAATAR